MNDFEKIEAYLEGYLDEAGKQAFEAELATNPILKQKFNSWIETEAILKKHIENVQGVEDLKKQLTPLTQQYFSTSSKKQAKLIPFKKYILAATTIAAALIIYFSFLGGIDDYSVPTMPQAAIRGTQNTTNIGAQLFNEEKYKEALPYLQKSRQNNPGDATATFFYGIALVKNNLYKEALPIFEDLVNGNSAYKKEAYFFAALSAFKLGDTLNAAHYAKLVEQGNTYYNKAQKILKKID